MPPRYVWLSALLLVHLVLLNAVGCLPPDSTSTWASARLSLVHCQALLLATWAAMGHRYWALRLAAATLGLYYLGWQAHTQQVFSTTRVSQSMTLLLAEALTAGCATLLLRLGGWQVEWPERFTTKAPGRLRIVHLIVLTAAAAVFFYWLRDSLLARDDAARWPWMPLVAFRLAWGGFAALGLWALLGEAALLRRMVWFTAAIVAWVELTIWLLDQPAARWELTVMRLAAVFWYGGTLAIVRGFGLRLVRTGPQDAAQAQPGSESRPSSNLS